MIAKFALVFILAVASLLATNINGQATEIVAGSSGSTSAVQGMVISLSQFTNASGWGVMAPYAYTNLDVAATSDNLIIVHTNQQSAGAFTWNMIWSFNAEESATIRTYFAGLSLRNNLEVRFTATWNSEGRFAIDTSAWTFVYQSLMPYGLSSSCNLTQMVINSLITLTVLPDSCSQVLVPGQKNVAQTFPECLLFNGKTALDLNTACLTVRSYLETVYCTDGASGVELLCTYNEDFLPSGVAGEAVFTVGSDGFPTSGRANQQGGPSPASAGAIFSTVVGVIAVIVAMMI